MRNVASKLSIIKMAVSYVGEGSIATLLDDAPVTNWMNGNYDIIKENFLQGYTWREALKEESLAKLAEAGKFGFTYAYEAPSDFLLVYKVGVDSQYYKYAGGVFHSSTDGLDLQYIANIGEGEFSSPMANALSGKIGLDYAIAKNKPLDGIRLIEQTAMADARNASSRQDNPPTRRGEIPMIAARRGWGYPSGGRGW